MLEQCARKLSTGIIKTPNAIFWYTFGTIHSISEEKEVMKGIYKVMLGYFILLWLRRN